jgi:hypothetical protein
MKCEHRKCTRDTTTKITIPSDKWHTPITQTRRKLMVGENVNMETD